MISAATRATLEGVIMSPSVAPDGVNPRAGEFAGCVAEVPVGEGVITT